MIPKKCSVKRFAEKCNEQFLRILLILIMIYFIWAWVPGKYAYWPFQEKKIRNYDVTSYSLSKALLFSEEYHSIKSDVSEKKKKKKK